MVKSDWTLNDTVMPEDMNQIGKIINESADQLAGATPIAVPYTLVKRDIFGRTKVGTPSDLDDAARLGDLLILPTSSLHRNAIINSNFDIWQRGTTFNFTGYTADRWLFSIGAGNKTTVTRQSLSPGTVPGAVYCIQLDISVVGTGVGILQQRVEDVRNFAGQKVTLSFWARCTSGTYVLANDFFQNFGTSGSAGVNIPLQESELTTSWKKITRTFNIPSINGKTIGSGSFLTCGFLLRPTAGVNTLQIAQVSINSGDQAFQYQPRHISEELVLCQRYFEKSYNLADVPGTVSAFAGGVDINSTGSTNFMRMPITFKNNKRTVPTVIPYSPHSGVSGRIYSSTREEDIGATVGLVNESGFKIQTSNIATSAGEALTGQWIADAEL